MAENRGIDCNGIGGSAQELMEDYIARDFEASVDVCHGRIEYDRLWDKQQPAPASPPGHLTAC